MKRLIHNNLKLIAGLPLLLLFYFPNWQSQKWIAPKEADQMANPFLNDENALEKGKETYKQLCIVCHGDKGKGDGIAGVALNPLPADLTKDIVQSQSDGAIYWKITNGKPPMASYKDILSDEQRWQLVNYIRTLKKDTVKKKK